MPKCLHYTDTLNYEIEQVARLLRLISVRVFEKLEIDVTPDEYVALDTILCNSGICQRDLAKLILKDRANTGRILDSLEEKGLITRFIDTKNNRLVKKMGLTESGVKKIHQINKKIEGFINSSKRKLTDEELENIHSSLKKLRCNLEEVFEMKNI